MADSLPFGQNFFLKNLAKGEKINSRCRMLPDNPVLRKKLEYLILSDKQKSEEIKALKEVNKQYEAKIVQLVGDMNKRSVELDMCLNILGQIKNAATSRKTLEKVLSKFTFDCIDMNSLSNIH